MLSFLVDTRCFLGSDRQEPLAQGNLPPIAVDDPVTVPRSSGPVTISVLDNDVDPEGQPLTLVSAFAALGTAVAEADNTVTYTPPAGAVQFDTVVYEIEDVEGERDTGQIDITISDPTVTVSTLPGNTIAVDAGSGAIDITITQPAVFAGTYQADTGDLVSGPANLVAPTVSGTPATGQELTAGDGLWIYDTGAGLPSQNWQWQRGGVDIPGETGASYIMQAGDAGPGIGVVETLTDSLGARSSASAVAGAFTPADDTAVVGWWDADDAAMITATGDAVSAWASKTGTLPLNQGDGARQPTTGTRTLAGRNVLDFDGADFLDQTVTLPASGDVAFHMVLDLDSVSNAFEAVLSVDATNDFQIDAGDTEQFNGRLNVAGIGTTTDLSGGPFSGPFILSVIADRTGNGQVEVFISGILRGATAYTQALDADATLHVMANRTPNAWINGAVAELVVTGDVTNRLLYHSYLSTKWGIA